ncbi:unnamed protein product [Closterium sp. Yama58-4]|nr:unnamed protein product [Closterium sp. Yama58-4]
MARASFGASIEERSLELELLLVSLGAPPSFALRHRDELHSRRIARDDNGLSASESIALVSHERPSSERPSGGRPSGERPLAVLASVVALIGAGKYAAALERTTSALPVLPSADHLAEAVPADARIQTGEAAAGAAAAEAFFRSVRGRIATLLADLGEKTPSGSEKAEEGVGEWSGGEKALLVLMMGAASLCLPEPSAVPTLPLSPPQTNNDTSAAIQDTSATPTDTSAPASHPPFLASEAARVALSKWCQVELMTDGADVTGRCHLPQYLLLARTLLLPPLFPLLFLLLFLLLLFLLLLFLLLSLPLLLLSLCKTFWSLLPRPAAALLGLVGGQGCCYSPEGATGALPLPPRPAAPLHCSPGSDAGEERSCETSFLWKGGGGNGGKEGGGGWKGGGGNGGRSGGGGGGGGVCAGGSNGASGGWDDGDGLCTRGHCQECGVVLSVTGAMGYRTIHQVDPKAQLVLSVTRTEALRGGDGAVLSDMDWQEGAEAPAKDGKGAEGEGEGAKEGEEEEEEGESMEELECLFEPESDVLLAPRLVEAGAGAGEAVVGSGGGGGEAVANGVDEGEEQSARNGGGSSGDTSGGGGGGVLRGVEQAAVLAMGVDTMKQNAADELRAVLAMGVDTVKRNAADELRVALSRIAKPSSTGTVNIKPVSGKTAMLIASGGDLESCQAVTTGVASTEPLLSTHLALPPPSITHPHAQRVWRAAGGERVCGRGHACVASAEPMRSTQHLFPPPTPLVTIREYGELLVASACVGEAMRVFETNELWDHLIDCYSLLGKRAAAAALVTARLKEQQEDPRLWCCLGDLTEEKECYEKAWEFSRHRYARAQVWRAVQCGEVRCIVMCSGDMHVLQVWSAVQCDALSSVACGNVVLFIPLHPSYTESTGAHGDEHKGLHSNHGSLGEWGRLLLNPLHPSPPLFTPLIQRALARMAMNTKDFKTAMAHWEAALAISPLHASAWFSLGYSAIQAVASGAGVPEIYRLQGTFLEVVGDADVAAEAFLRHVRSLQSASWQHGEPDAFRQLAQAALRWTAAVVRGVAGEEGVEELKRGGVEEREGEGVRVSGAGKRRLASVRMLLSNILKQGDHFSDVGEFGELKAALGASFPPLSLRFPLLPTSFAPTFQLPVNGDCCCPSGCVELPSCVSLSPCPLLPHPARPLPLLLCLPLLSPPHSHTLPHRFQPLGNLHGGASALPLGNLHGGVSALVTEAVGSLGAAVAAGAPVVGVEVACSHLRAAPIGTPLIAVGTPLRVGRTVQVWEVRLSAPSDRVPAQGESAPVSELTFESIKKGAARRPSHAQSPDSKAAPSLEPQQQPLPPEGTPEGTPEGFKAGRLLAVGRLTCVPLPQSLGGGANGENGENGNGGGEKGGNRNGGEASRREESGALGNREEGSGEAEQWSGESQDEHEGTHTCRCIDFPPFDTPPFNGLPIHKFIGLRFLSACPHRVVAGFVSSPATAEPLNNVHGGVSAIITETLGSTGASLAAGGLVVGVEVAVSHLRPCPLGTPVVAVAVPLRAGRTVQVWEVRFSVQKQDEQRRDEQRQGHSNHAHQNMVTRAEGEVSGGRASLTAPRSGQLLAVGRLTAVVVGKGNGEERGKARL